MKDTVLTYVMEYNDEIMWMPLQRNESRPGLLLYNRVRTIERIKEV